MVSVGKYRLFAYCRGNGSPAVILDSGYGQELGFWDRVQESVSRFTTVCAYDRAGIAPSESRPHGTWSTARSAVADLHVLLAGLHLKPPYVLVGHSIGGINVRLYAYTYRHDVAGMVLVDAAHEGECRWPVCSIPPLENYNIRASFAQVRAATAGRIRGSLGAIPLVVLTRGLYSPGATLAGVWRMLQRQLASASSNSVHLVASYSGHDIPHDQPDLVIRGIQVVVGAVHARSHRLGPCVRLFPGRLHGICQ